MNQRIREERNKSDINLQSALNENIQEKTQLKNEMIAMIRRIKVCWQYRIYIPLLK